MTTNLQAPDPQEPVSALPDEALQFLRCIGRADIDQVRVRGFRHKDHPDRGKARKDTLLGADLLQWQENGFSIYAVINRGGDTDASITEVVAVFIEWDDRPIEEQLDFDWEAFGFPAPSVQVYSGGKSLHCYWPLSEPCIEISRWRQVMERMVRVFQSDKAIKNPSRVMRLPGYRYALADGSLGALARLDKCNDRRFTLDELEEALQLIERQQVVAEAVDRPRPIRRDNIVEFPQSRLLLEQLLTREHKEQLAAGVGEGNRNATAFALTVDAIACADELNRQGVPYDGTPAEVLEDFARRCSPPIDDREVLQVWASAQKHNCQVHPNFQGQLDFLLKPQKQRVESKGGTRLPGKKKANSIPKQPQRLLEPFDPKHAAEIESKELEQLDVRTLGMLLRNSYGARLRFNTLQGRPELDGKPLHFSLDQAYVVLGENGWRAAKDWAIDVILTVAREHSFCPILEYLKNVEDTVKPLDITRLASQLLRPEDKDLAAPTIYDRMLEVNLIGAIRRVFEPGCQHDTTAILYSAEQGKGKTTFWETLAAGFFCGDFKDHTHKDDLMKLHSAWLVEWGEIDQITSKRDVSELKHFLTVKSDRIRVPYGRETEVYPRRGIIVGSTNREDFMTDETGNRRFHVIPVTTDRISVQQVAELRDAIWAGAVAAYRSGRKNYLDRQEEDDVNKLNLGHLQQSDWQPVIATWLAGPGELNLKAGRLTTATVLEEAIQKPRGQWTKRDANEVSRVLKALGLEQVRLRIGGARQYVWQA